MTKKKLLISITIVLVIFISYFLLSPNDTDTVYLTAPVKKGDFLSEVITSGEAQSTNSKNINGPRNGLQFGIYNIKIQDLVPEGTVVKKGDYIGKLDTSELNGKILDARLN